MRAVLPEKGPRITGGLAKYQDGDLVQMNCTSAPSKPAALLTWFINGEPVSGTPDITIGYVTVL